ncbi:MAG: APC family permease, partial [Candidatus Eremiobacteraeota bacterium]|nr:APC family permease [Candidatus Eremiobacteraeota bacterium]
MAAEARELPKVLKFFDLSVLASAAMGPAYSLASTMGPVVAAAGYYSPLAILALSAIMLCVACAFWRLSRIAPNAGSSYSWIEMAFGPRLGAYGAWMLLLANFFAVLAVSVPAGIYTLDLLSPVHAQDPRWNAGVGALWIVGSSVLLYLGMRPTALVTALALLAELGVLAVSALVAGQHAPPIAVTSHPLALTSLGFFSAMTLGIWMSDGWEVSASTSEEVDDRRSASGMG